MPRKRPTSKLGVYGKFDLNPENAVELYNASRAQNKYFIKEPSWNAARDSLELNAIINRRENDEVRQMQARMRRNAKRDAEVNKCRTNEITDVQMKLREKFVEVSDFVRDCNAKEAIAVEKIRKELHAQQEMTTEIERLTKDIACLNAFKEELSAKVAEYSPYKEVVEQVLAETDLYKNKKDLIDRCDALLLAQVEVAEKEQECIQSVAEMREDMAKTTSDANLIILGLEGALNNIEKEYEEAKRNAVEWEKSLESTKNVIIDKEFLTWRLLDQIQQLYKLFCQRNSVDVSLKRHEVEEQLDYIKEEIETIQEIIDASEQMMDRESKSDIAQDGSYKSK